MIFVVIPEPRSSSFVNTFTDSWVVRELCWRDRIGTILGQQESFAEEARRDRIGTILGWQESFAEEAGSAQFLGNSRRVLCCQWDEWWKTWRCVILIATKLLCVWPNWNCGQMPLDGYKKKECRPTMADASGRCLGAAKPAPFSNIECLTSDIPISIFAPWVFLL